METATKVSSKDKMIARCMELLSLHHSIKDYDNIYHIAGILKDLCDPALTRDEIRRSLEGRFHFSDIVLNKLFEEW
jgi:hypothetical protein